MGAMKKAPLAAAFAPAGESGPAVIEGDRTLLSHCAVARQHGASSASARRSAIRRNFIAKGLARQYVEQKAREGVYKTQVPRFVRQQRILETHQRRQANRASDKDCERSGKEPRGSDDENDDEDEEFSENVVLVVRSRLASTRTTTPNRPARRSPPVVFRKGAACFPRTASLRQLVTNQTHEAETQSDAQKVGVANSGTTGEAEKPSSPREVDLSRISSRRYPRFAPCVSYKPTKHQRESPPPSATVEQDAHLRNLPGAPPPWVSTANRSSMIVLCELNVTKEIVLREQVVRQLEQALSQVDGIARQLLDVRRQKHKAEAMLEATKASSPARIRTTPSLTGSVTTTPAHGPDTAQAKDTAAQAAREVSTLASQFAKLTKTAHHRMQQIETLVGGLQQATLRVVEGVVEWRQLRQQCRKLSNFQRLFRFPWKKRKIANYLLHLDRDWRQLFPSVALELLLGRGAKGNPLLLSKRALASLGITAEASSATKTFVTEREDSANRTRGDSALFNVRSPNISDLRPRIQRSELPALCEALAGALGKISEKASPSRLMASSGDQARLGRCLEVISNEKELEALEEQWHGDDEQRRRGGYDPFLAIKAAGGVEETLMSMMERQSPNAQLLAEKLRHRQENTTRASLAVPLSVVPDAERDDEAVQVLRVNRERLRTVLSERLDPHESTADCELVDVQHWGVKNKLPGQLLVRKTNRRRMENHVARKIQLQFLVHRRRVSIQSNLSRFVRTVRVSVITIQRVFRGHQAKCKCDDMKQMWLEERQRVSATRTIVNAFRRHRRQQRHRRSMTVESIAQTQLIHMLETKLHDSYDAQEAAERYRRVGEERRRQRIMLLHKHKMEQQAQERKRASAAVRLQSVVRSHLAKGEARTLRQEKKAHMSAVCAMAIQSKIRKFLDHQEERRRRFRRDLERVNESAVRIQSIYRGYNSRASLLFQLDEKSRQMLDRGVINTAHHEMGEKEESDDNESDEEEEDEQDEGEGSGEGDTFADGGGGAQSGLGVRLPPLAPSSARLSSTSSSTVLYEERHSSMLDARHAPTKPELLPLLQTRGGSSRSLSSNTASSCSSRRPSLSSVGMTREELKLKEPVIGDKFDPPPSRRTSFMGRVQRQ